MSSASSPGASPPPGGGTFPPPQVLAAPAQQQPQQQPRHHSLNSGSSGTGLQMGAAGLPQSLREAIEKIHAAPTRAVICCTGGAGQASESLRQLGASCFLSLLLGGLRLVVEALGRR